MDLSFNLIEDLSGFEHVKNSSHSLEHVLLHGNNINQLEAAIRSLANCGTLRSLTFEQVVIFEILIVTGCNVIVSNYIVLKGSAGPGHSF